jgi:DNA-binding Lrp family transcriptional regulator
MTMIDQTDKLIINRIQSDFPINRNPFGSIAKELGLTESDVLNRVRKLKENGIIRRIGGNFSPEKVGFFSTLCAAKVPDDQINKFAEYVNTFPGVTHNYVRENDFNIWFTFIASSVEKIADNIKTIKNKNGIDTIANLPATMVFKINAQFKL